MPDSATVTRPKTSVTSKQGPKIAKRWSLILWNDSVNDMDYVCDCLVRVLHIDHGSAYEIMITAHETGRAIAGVFSKEIAELRAEQLSAFSLTTSIESE